MAKRKREVCNYQLVLIYLLCVCLFFYSDVTSVCKKFVNVFARVCMRIIWCYCNHSLVHNGLNFKNKQSITA